MLDECYELIVKLTREGGQVGVPIFKYLNKLSEYLIFKNCETVLP
jgi:cob(I)alamin adenosyltransferase